MKLHRALLLLPASALLFAAGPSTQSGTKEADCVVDVWTISNFSWDTARPVIVHDFGPMAHDMLGITPESLQIYLSMQPANRSLLRGDTFPDSGQSHLSVVLSLDEKAQPAAREFLDKMIQSLPAELDHLQRGEYEEQLSRIINARARQASEDQRVKDAEDELRGMGMGNRSTADIRELVKSLDEQNQNLHLDVAALTAQSGVLNDTVEKMNAEAARKAADDPVAKELETIVKLKEDRLEMLRASARAGNSPTIEVQDAEAAAAEARVQLLERREAVARGAGGDALADFQKQLVTVQVNLAQDKARLDAIAKQSDVLNKALAIYIDSANVARARQNPSIDTTDGAIENIRRRLDAIPKAAVRVVSESAS